MPNKTEYIAEINNLLTAADIELLDFVFQLLQKIPLFLVYGGCDRGRDRGSFRGVSSFPNGGIPHAL